MYVYCLCEPLNEILRMECVFVLMDFVECKEESLKNRIFALSRLFFFPFSISFSLFFFLYFLRFLFIYIPLYLYVTQPNYIILFVTVSQWQSVHLKLLILMIDGQTYPLYRVACARKKVTSNYAYLLINQTCKVLISVCLNFRLNNITAIRQYFPQRPRLMIFSHLFFVMRVMGKFLITYSILYKYFALYYMALWIIFI